MRWIDLILKTYSVYSKAFNTVALTGFFVFLISCSTFARIPQQKSILEFNKPATKQSNLPAPRLTAPIPTYPAPSQAKRNQAVAAISQRPSTENKLKAMDASDDVNRIVTHLVLDSMPHEYIEDKDWGGTTERWNGVSVQRDGLRIKTHRKKKTVNHGTWKKYSASLVDPYQSFKIQVTNLRELSDQKFGFDLNCQSKLQIDARQSKWVKGVQLYSLSASGTAQVNLALAIEVGVQTEATQLPPDLVIRPKVIDVDISVEDFRIDRVSKAGGEIARQVTRAARSAIEKKLESEAPKLANKINRQIQKKQDKLRFSMADAAKSKWFQMFQQAQAKPSSKR